MHYGTHRPLCPALLALAALGLAALTLGCAGDETFGATGSTTSASSTTSTGSGGGGTGGAGTCDAGETCAPAAGAGWSGPVALFSGATAPPACPGGAAALASGHGGEATAEITCAACTCDAAANESCVGPMVTAFSQGSCGGSSATVAVASDGTCAPLASAVRDFTVGPTGVQGGGCAAQGGAATLGEIGWSLQVAVCAIDASPSPSCDGTCATPLEAPFDPRPCVYQAGDALACPAGYPDQLVFYTGADADTRGCSACDCGSPSGGSCQGVATAHGGFACDPAASAHGLKSDGTCDSSPAGGATYGSIDFAVSGITPGACAASGGDPEGAVAGSGAITVCCTAQ